MDPQAIKLYSDTYDKNMIDKDEYPMTAMIEERCVRIVADLWNAPGEAIGTPNLVMSAAVQVVWEKFCNYWEVEPKYVPVTLDSPNLTPVKMLAHVDENTIGVVGILGVTYTGSYEPIKDLAVALDELQERTGLDVPLHVDGASGAMVAPFLQPDLELDVRDTAEFTKRAKTLR